MQLFIASLILVSAVLFYLGAKFKKRQEAFFEEINPALDEKSWMMIVAARSLCLYGSAFVKLRKSKSQKQRFCCIDNCAILKGDIYFTVVAKSSSGGLINLYVCRRCLTERVISEFAKS